MNRKSFILFLLTLLVSSSSQARQHRETLSSHLQGGSLVYYGAEPEDKSGFANAKVIILESRHWSTRSIQKLRSQGKVVFSYLSVSEISRQSPEHPKYRLMSENADWDTWRVHPGDPAWRRSVLEKVRTARLRGVDGVMLDTVDVTALHPESHQEMVGLIREIRAEIPDRYILVNRGFTVLHELADSIDGVLFENANDTRYSRSDREWIEHTCRTLSRLGLPVLLLDYQDRSSLKITSAMAERYGWSFYLAPHRDLVQLGPLPNYRT